MVGADDKEETSYQPQEVSQVSERETKGVGQAEIEDIQKGHDANTSKKQNIQPSQSNFEREKKRERPGKSDEDRSLGDVDGRVEKRLKTLDKLEEGKEEQEDGFEKDKSDLYQHIKEAKKNDTQVLDAATKVSPDCVLPLHISCYFVNIFFYRTGTG